MVHTSVRKNARNSTNVIITHPKSPQKPMFQLRSLDKYFWYTSSDGVIRLATSTDTPDEIPEQINTYILSPTHFAQTTYPSTFQPGGIWPPEELSDLLYPHGPEHNACVGDRCFTDTICGDRHCRHTFENWKQATQNWEDSFELRMTEDRGVGVYTKRAFKRDVVLGWYAGEIKKSTEYAQGDYLMELEIGFIPGDADEEEASRSVSPLTPSAHSSSMLSISGNTLEEAIMIDASRRGNWTRFINHSCEAYANFCIRRVGNIRIMVVQAVDDIPAGVELTVNYGTDYYGIDTTKVCCCGAQTCVGKLREKTDETRRKKKVKKCRRLRPPDDR